jgi:hypothetical protein
MPAHHSIFLSLTIATLSGCAAGGGATSLAQTSPAQAATPTPRPSAQIATAVAIPVAAQPTDFASWRTGFRHQALAQGILA